VLGGRGSARVEMMKRNVRPAGGTPRVLPARSFRAQEHALPPAETWALLVILALAFLLRFYRLDGQSLWADEGTSVALALRSLPQIARDASHDIHPLLYYFLLHYWVRLFGTTEVAVRSLSVVCGTLLAAVTYAIGRQILNRPVALVAAFVAALSPFQIDYSQETRMYILSALLGAASFCALLAMLRAADRRRQVMWHLIYGVTAIAMLYTHYFAVTLLLAQNVVWLVWVGQSGRWRRWQRWAQWLIGQVIVACSFLPWLWYARDSLRSWPAISAPFSLLYLLGEVWRVFSLGLSVPPRFDPLLLVFGLFVVLGLASTLRRNHSETQGMTVWGVPVVYLAVPILLTYLASLRRPVYNPKFLLLATPPFHLLLAAGILFAWDERARRRSTLQRLWVVAGLSFVLVAAIRPLHNYYFDPHYARDDYRSLVRFVESVAGPDDALLINAPGQVEIVDYYTHGRVPEFPLPQRRPPDRAETEAALRDLAARYKHIYAVLWATEQSDPQGIVTGWLATHTYPAGTVWYGNVRLATYAVPQASARTPEPMDVVFGDRIRLRAFALRTPATASGDVVQLTLFWEALRPLNRRYKVFTHLLDAEDHIVGQRDAEPLAGLRPTNGWKPGGEITDRYGVPVLWGTPPGNYRLEVGLYDAETGMRLTTAESDRVVLGTVEVTRPAAWPPLSAFPIQQRADDGVVGGLRLRGWNLTRLGSNDPLGQSVPAGTPLELVFYWQRGAALPTSLGLTVQLIASDKVITSWDTSPLGGRYPPARWSRNEVIRDPHTLFLPPALPPGRYTLALRAPSPSGNEPLVLSLGQILVQ